MLLTGEATVVDIQYTCYKSHKSDYSLFLVVVFLKETSTGSTNSLLYHLAGAARQVGCNVSEKEKGWCHAGRRSAAQNGATKKIGACTSGWFA